MVVWWDFFLLCFIFANRCGVLGESFPGFFFYYMDGVFGALTGLFVAFDLV